MDAPPLLISFQNVENYLEAMEIPMDSGEAESIRRLVSAKLPPVISKTSLAVIFGYTPRFIGAMLRNPERYYRQFEIVKGGKRRSIHSPKVGLKSIQKWLGFHLSRNVSLSPAAVGFIPGVSAIDGAARHCGNSWIFSTDIKDFFSTTPISLVHKPLISLGYSTYAASIISNLSCLKNGLAQGSPCSPVLSNLAAMDLDKALEQYAYQNGLTYTRYADDIVVSGNSNIPNGIKEIIFSEIEKRGWTVSEEKTSIQISPKRLKVYGLLVHGERPRLTKGYRNRIRAIQHLLETKQIPAERVNESKGHLSYAKSVYSWNPISKE